MSRNNWTASCRKFRKQSEFIGNRTSIERTATRREQSRVLANQLTYQRYEYTLYYYYIQNNKVNIVIDKKNIRQMPTIHN